MSENRNLNLQKVSPKKNYNVEKGNPSELRDILFNVKIIFIKYNYYL